MDCNERCHEESCKYCPKSKIKEIHCTDCKMDLEVYYYIDDKCLCLNCAIKYVQDNIEQFQKEYDEFETEQDIIDCLNTHYKNIF